MERAQDTILLGGGNDTALESDGSVDGQSGTDTVRMNGTDESEEFTLQALGTHARIVRDTGPGVADLVRVEAAEVLAGGGPDLVDVGDLSATELTRVDADLGLFDGAPDTVFAAGTDAVDGIGASVLGDDGPRVRAEGRACASRTRTPTGSSFRPAAATTS